MRKKLSHMVNSWNKTIMRSVAWPQTNPLDDGQLMRGWEALWFRAVPPSSLFLFMIHARHLSLWFNNRERNENGLSYQINSIRSCGTKVFVLVSSWRQEIRMIKKLNCLLSTWVSIQGSPYNQALNRICAPWGPEKNFVLLEPRYMKVKIAHIIICMILIKSPRVSLLTVWMNYALDGIVLSTWFQFNHRFCSSYKRVQVVEIFWCLAENAYFK